MAKKKVEKAASETTANMGSPSHAQTETAAKPVAAKGKTASKKALPIQAAAEPVPAAEEHRAESQAKVDLPKAFSVRDENEILPIQHLMERLNPHLMVHQAATGVHVNGGETVCWGLVYSKSDLPSQQKVEMALREAGFDFDHSASKQTAIWHAIHPHANHPRGEKT